MLSKKSSQFNTVCYTILSSHSMLVSDGLNCYTILSSHSMLVSDGLKYAKYCHLFVTFLYSDQKCEMASGANNVF